MTSKRSIERRLDALEQRASADHSDVMIVWEDPDTGERYADPELTDPVDAVEGDPLVIVVRDTVVETDWTPERSVEGEL